MDKFKESIGSRQAILAAAVVMLLAGILALHAAEKPERALLGVTVRSLDGTEREKLGIQIGVEVAAVEKDGAAAKAGIKEGDIIQWVNGEKIRDAGDLVAIIGELAPGATATIGLWRDGKTLDVAPVLGQREPRGKFVVKNKERTHVFGSGGYLGIVLQELNSDLAPYFNVKAGEGVLIMRVEKDTPAEKAGLKAGDVIVRMGDRAVANAKAVHEALADLKKGENVAIAIVRRGKKETVKAEPDFDRHPRIFRIYRGGHDLGSEPLEIPDLEIEVPPLPDMPQFEEELRHVHENMDRVKIEINKHIDHIREGFWI